jgi:hypothetical protein
VIDSSRRSLLTTALVGALLPANIPGGPMLRGWLDTWAGVGHVLDAMTATGFHVELRQSVFGCASRIPPRGHAAFAIDLGRGRD